MDKIMPNRSFEDHLGGNSHLSSLIIEEILENIISSSLSVSSTKPVVFDTADDFTDHSVPGCDKDTSVTVKKMEYGAKNTKRISFNEDLTVVCYEQIPVSVGESSESECLKMKEDHQEMETEETQKQEETGSGYDNQVDPGGNNEQFSMLKRKCNDSVLEDDFVIPLKVIKPEADLLLISQDGNEGKLQVSQHHIDENKAKDEADQKEVEADFDSSVAILNRESDLGQTTNDNRVTSSTLGCPSDMASAVEDNSITVSLLSDDDAIINDTHQSGPFSNDEMIDDCRFVLQSIVDIIHVTHGMLQSASLDRNSDDTSDVAEQPPTKKIKFASSDIQASKNSLSFTTIPYLPIAEAMDSSPNNVPLDVDKSTEDVEQLYVPETKNTKAWFQEATVLYDNFTLDLLSDEKSGQSYRSLQVSSDSTDESTSTPDVMANEDVKCITLTEQANVASELGEEVNVVEHNKVLLSNDLEGEDGPYTSTLDVEEADNDPDISKDETNTYSHVLAQDLQLDESEEECSEQPECLEIELHGTQGGNDGNALLSSSDVEVVKSQDVYVDAIEPSLQEDIMPSPGSSDDDFSCTFQTASQVLANSQERIYSHSLGEFSGMTSRDPGFMENRELQVPSAVPFNESQMQDVGEDDWKTFRKGDESISKVPEISVQGHPDSQEHQSTHQHVGCKAEYSSLEIPDNDFLQVLGLSPKHKLTGGEERKSCDFSPSETFTLPSPFPYSLLKDIEETEEIETCIPLLHPIFGYLDCPPKNSSKLESSPNMEMTLESGRVHENLTRSPIQHSEMKPAADLETSVDVKLSIKEVNVGNDQTVPSLQAPGKENPCIDQLLELEESIFSEQDTKQEDGPIKQSIHDQKKTASIKDSEDKPIPDHLQTLGQTAAGVFLWSHSLPDPSLTPRSLTQHQNTLLNTAHNQTPPITPVRPLPVCQRKRRIGLSRRQLVYPLHARTLPRK
ncbi:uncharacterized protein LOC121431445 [Lytechinus variegatus]|uniref:uncharacterized protein LOC121431445 n=1 Tax=Lytechinus variegatus TaxID=7654 RepID=UPI001BB290E2|nr:uncharacterized protein LOC121431445 [Lytechinus variegatus]